ncbi:MAG: alpha/beta hydrolase [Sphingobacteriales bacterium]|nr:MAG: alpha/beta hydrolase [Sphingobacteriales bacterium]
MSLKWSLRFIYSGILTIITSCSSYQAHVGRASNRIDEDLSPSRGPVILVSGGPALGRYINTLGALLKSDFEVVEYAQIGTLDNLEPLHADVISQMVEQLHLVITANSNNKKPVIVGHSWGAVLGLIYTERYPESLSGLNIVSSGILNSEIRNQFEKTILCRLSRSERLQRTFLYDELGKTSDETQRNLIGSKIFNLILKTYNNDTSRSLLPTELSWKIDSSITISKATRNWIELQPLKERFRSTLFPVSIFHGDKDPIPYQQTIEVYKSIFKNPRIDIYRDAGQFLWLEPFAKDQFIIDIKKAIHSQFDEDKSS